MSKRKIMIVDDSEMILEMVKCILEEAGYEVVTRDSPFGTAVAASTEKPDLILLDVSMPALSGDRIVEVVKDNQKLKDVKVCLFSDRSIRELNELVLSCGADGFIQKTDNDDDFVRQVAAYMNR